MNHCYISIQALLQAIETNACLVLTPNHQVAHHLQTLYGQYLKRPVWQTPTIMPLWQWLIQGWQQIALKHQVPYLLTNAQSLALWQSIIQGSAFPWPPSYEAMQAMQDARALILEWLPKAYQTAEKLIVNEDTAQFQALYGQYQEKCHTQHWIDPPALIDKLLPYLPEIKLPPTMVWAGFHEFNRAQKTLLHKLQSHTKLYYHQPAISTAKAYLQPYDDQDEELTHMLAWAKHQALKGSSSIACVVPDLKANWSMILRYCHEQIAPHECSSLFNLSVSQHLKHYPLIDIALKLLACSEQLNKDWISTLLLTPYWQGGLSERRNRQKLELYWLSYGPSFLTFNEFYNQLPRLSAIASCPLLTMQFDRMKHHREQTRLLAPSTWSHYFSQFLHDLGWPGEQGLQSAEYPIFQRWQNLLEAFSKLDPVLKTISLAQAVTQLHHLIYSDEPQMQTSGAPIQLLEPLEAAGQTFDKLWIMGMDHQHWPKAPEPNAFIPHTLQAQFALPHATWERAYQLSQQLTQGFLTASHQTIVSYAQHQAEQYLRPSPLVAHLPPISEPLNPSLTAITPVEMEYIDDCQGPPLTVTDLTMGGVQLFKDQALCPFKAFATHRLHAKDLITTSWGISPLHKGQWLHQALEWIWKLLENQQRLQALSHEELHSLIEQAIAHTIVQTQHLWMDCYLLDIESKRLSRLLHQWLHLERQRPPFTVTAIEENMTVSFAGMKIKLRIDRIDRIAPDSYLIIDYKTGPASIQSWLDHRLEEPQLPLYALAQNQTTAIAYGQIRSEAIELKGISQVSLDISEIIAADKLTPPYQWPELLNHWQTSLQQIANEIKTGWAKVQPKHGKATCRHCHLMTLCRIYDK